jgi:TolB protein
MLMDVETVTEVEVPTDPGTMAFGPRFSPDGRWIIYSRAQGGDTDIWQMDPGTGAGRPLIAGPAIETAPSYSPDGTQIVFESDRSGTSQLYVIGADGSGEPLRISFGEGSYGAPAWSPKGDLIAFTRQDGDKFHIGVMRPDGSGEKTLTESFLDEGPTWAPNGRVVMFTRQTPGGNGVARLHSVDVTGRNMRPLDIQGAASDPDWGPLLP